MHNKKETHHNEARQSVVIHLDGERKKKPRKRRVKKHEGQGGGKGYSRPEPGRAPSLIMAAPAPHLPQETNPLLRELEKIRLQLSEAHKEQPRNALLSRVYHQAEPELAAAEMYEENSENEEEHDMQGMKSHLKRGGEMEKYNDERPTRYTGENPLTIEHRQEGGRAREEEQDTRRGRRKRYATEEERREADNARRRRNYQLQKGGVMSMTDMEHHKKE